MSSFDELSDRDVSVVRLKRVAAMAKSQIQGYMVEVDRLQAILSEKDTLLVDRNEDLAVLKVENRSLSARLLVGDQWGFADVPW